MGVCKILETNGIEIPEEEGSSMDSMDWPTCYDPVLIDQHVPGNGCNGQITMVIVAEWDDATSLVVWERALKQIKRFIDVIGAGKRTRP